MLNRFHVNEVFLQQVNHMEAQFTFYSAKYICSAKFSPCLLLSKDTHSYKLEPIYFSPIHSLFAFDLVHNLFNIRQSSALGLLQFTM